MIIALMKHLSWCFQRYWSRRKLAYLPHELRKDMGIMQDDFEREVSKGNIVTLGKELCQFAHSNSMSAQVRPSKGKHHDIRPN
ncbi:hypothetical protein [Marinomonas aquiplantarum]|uniref:DUF1127 domain-containing protein n=1 Tax=Marinomonas aquiplantarum TaxID=491951 RepID=A0A366CWT0_9GAMM|nr:hypothetical protein [Marinomonas aquiplantarum]RBO80197.1 hypothetical protein DFP76_10860 [Marinomonas aquiplantarum]